MKHFKPKHNRSPPTNLDLLCRTLSEVTGKPQGGFRQAICTAIEGGHMPAANLLKPADPDQYERLQAEKAGILNWLIEGQLPTT